MYHLQILESHKVNTISSNHKWSIDDLIHMIDSPIEGLEKAELPYFMPFSYKNVPCARNEDNIDRFNLLFLDYDDTISYQEAINNFSRFEFLFYTSFGNGVDGKKKFRIILILDKEYPAFAWRFGYMKKVLMSQKMFKGVDPNALKVQGFYVPAINPNGKYYAHYNKGEKFPLEYLTPVLKKVILDQAVNERIMENKTFAFTGQVKCVKTFKFKTPIGEKTVNDWLSTRFNSNGKNVWCEIGLFQCFRLCKRYNDEETRSQVWQKARSEMWTEQELQRKWESIK